MAERDAFDDVALARGEALVDAAQARGRSRDRLRRERLLQGVADGERGKELSQALLVARGKAPGAAPEQQDGGDDALLREQVAHQERAHAQRLFDARGPGLARASVHRKRLAIGDDSILLERELAQPAEQHGVLVPITTPIVQRAQIDAEERAALERHPRRQLVEQRRVEVDQLRKERQRTAAERGQIGRIARELADGAAIDEDVAHGYERTMSRWRAGTHGGSMELTTSSNGAIVVDRANQEPAWLDRRLYPFAGHLFATGDGRMHYLDEGEGRPILFVHGTPSWSFEWRHAIAALRGGHRCIAPDHLGFGLSDKPERADYTPQGHAKRLLALVRTLDLRDLTLVVHDFGGPIGLPVLLEEPSRVRALVVVNSWAWAHAQDPGIRWLSRIVASPLGRFLYTWLNASPRF